MRSTILKRYYGASAYKNGILQLWYWILPHCLLASPRKKREQNTCAKTFPTRWAPTSSKYGLSPYGRSYFHGDPGSPKLRMGAWNLNTILRSLGTPQSSSENMTIDTLGGGPKATHLQRSFWGRPTCTLRISRDGSPQTSLFFGGRSNCLRPHRTTTKLVDDSFPNTPWEWYLPTKTIR